MNRNEALIIVDGHTMVYGGIYRGVGRHIAQSLMGDNKYNHLLRDAIHNTGPSPSALYPWNVVDYLVMPEPEPFKDVHKTLDIVYVSREHLGVQPMFRTDGGHTVYIRCELSGLKSIVPDVFILESGLSKEQMELVREKTRTNPKCRVFEEKPNVCRAFVQAVFKRISIKTVENLGLINDEIHRHYEAGRTIEETVTIMNGGSARASSP